MCKGVFCLHVYLCATCAGDKRGHQILRNRVTDNCEPSCGCWELNPGPLQEHQCSWPLKHLSSPGSLVFKHSFPFLHVHACMRACVYVCMYVHVYVCVTLHVCTRVCAHVHARVCVHVHGVCFIKVVDPCSRRGQNRTLSDLLCHCLS